MRVDVSPAAWSEETAQGWQPAKGQSTVWFTEEPVKNEYRSNLENRPVFDNQLWIHIIVPGDRTLELHHKANNVDRRKYAKILDDFLQKKDRTNLSGTPLAMWPQLDRRQVAELNALNIYTVEHLATLSDGYGTQIMGFHQLKEKATNFLKAAKGQSEFDALRAEVSKRDEQIAQMQKNYEEMQKKIQEMGQRKGGWPKGKPRKPKEVTDGL